jgi:predicted GH43/DUF377 family glycosyl hydrolase
VIAEIKQLLRITEKVVPVETPSILRQTDFRVGFFNFGAAEKKGVDYFNCGLVRRPDGLWLIVRRSRNQSRLHFGFNDLVAFLLDEQTRRPLRGQPIKMQKRWEQEQWEDARAVYHNGRTFISCCDFIWQRGSWTGAHQIMEEVSNDWQSIKRYDPVYGHNEDNLGKNKWHEKNWLWFIHEGEWHLIYKGNPHTVAKFNDDFELMDEWENPEVELGWEYGEIRGGTPPVRVGSEYWTFFHSSTPWRPPYRKYHMGVYAFRAEPPFKLTRVSMFPILTGSPDDPSSPTKPVVVFACGAVLENKKWFVTFGVNDLKCGFIEIPHEQLLKMTIEI